ncbi:epoxide hydrolase family protein [Steroidobacter agaridevorans]|uniref:epoxide hydrolase family protein n=1 Tax=Steroidobacter agaridevorans TaxID=2695856 RepID=UPI001323FC7C|nr:epoxide hydrolase family protein [Steroidobacter agaridevorans]GFE85864.1 multidrug MFS transporter [Steroidobacter agaridevorans]
MADFAIENFRFEAPPEALDDLQQRLRRTLWPDEVAAEPWRYGPPVAYMQRFIDYWLNKYDWRTHEARLNSFPQFVAQIDEHRTHFIHQVGNGPSPIPLVLTHGWPGSVVEMLKIIPLLTDPAAHGGDPADAFTVIAPSIPGYGFSSRPASRGTNVFVVADLWAKLMTGLNYPRFGVQGGDWGSWISAATALRHPQRIVGLHLNYLSTRFRPALSSSDPPLSAAEEDYLARVARWMDTEGAYIAIQGTKPLTLSYALTDSPAGLAAWFVEKFRSWSDNQLLPDEALTKDEMITDIMLYWLTGTAHSAMRFYSESREHPFHLAAGQKITPPCGIVHLPRELPMPPRSWAERAFNVVHWSTLPRGGHFAAWEQPELLAEDIRKFFRPLRSQGNSRDDT